MDFTELYKHTANLVAFSPGAHFILNAIQDRLIIRRSDSFQITRTWIVDSSPSPTNTVLDSQSQKGLKSKSTSNPGSSNTTATGSTDRNEWITHASWSSDSEHIFAACAKKGVVSVFQLRNEEWSARIFAGAEGLIKVEWAPDGRTLLCFSEWGLRITVWSLVTGTSTYIQFPIHPDKGYTFRSDGRYFVLAERHKSKDTLGVYDAFDSFKLVRHFPLPTTSVSSIALSPTDNYLAVWEGSLEYKLHVITLAGTLLTTFTPSPEPALGIRHVAWHPSGAFLAVGGWEDKVYILDSLSWSPVVTFEVSSRIPGGVTLWREPTNWQEVTEGRGFLSYDKIRTPYGITLTKPDVTKPNPKSGVCQLEWNKNGTILLVRFEATSNAVHLYHFPSPTVPSPTSFTPTTTTTTSSTTRAPRSPYPHSQSQWNPHLRSVLLHSEPVLHSRWNPVRPGSLVTSCGNRGVYLWSDEWQNQNQHLGEYTEQEAEKEGESEEVTEEVVTEEVAECVGVPAKLFDTRDLHWAPDGKGLVLLDRDKFCCAFEVEE
ncbi:YVTN repeat-like/Quino protein amine dehydrogenase [Marasmius fiardii PR-910]|nr:YVTN repeat-like/Quino protein amine dehydrogenase [Marasmius fiardii PR-910]